jgi:FkbM family methyltransferase
MQLVNLSSKVHPDTFGALIAKNFVRFLPNRRLFYPRATNSRYIRWLLPRNNTQMSAKLQNGMYITVDVNDYNGRMLYLFGIAYPEVVETCCALLKPGDNFLDIGANYASVGLLCADIVGTEGRVHIFEPQPHLCQSIRATIAQHKLHHVRLHPFGLMDRDDVLQMSVSSKHTGEGSFVLQHDQLAETICLEVKNIATYLPQFIGNKPFGAKVDVEGAEPHILPWLIQQPNLRFFIFENTHLRGQEKVNIYNDMKRNNLVLFGIKNDKYYTQIHLLDIENEKLHFHDILALKVEPSLVLPRVVTPKQLSGLVNH